MPYLTNKRASAVPTVAEAFAKANQAAVSVKQTLTYVRGRASTGDLTAQDVFINALTAVQNARAMMAAAAVVEGVAAYAEAQFPDVAEYDAAGSYAAFRDAMDAFTTFLENNFGAASQWSGYSLAQRNALIAQIDLVLAEVD